MVRRPSTEGEKMDIKLTYRNNSDDFAKSKIVVFQKLVNTDFDELAVAWKVIKNCGTGEYHPFVYPMEMKVGAIDSDGNYSQQIPATNGQVFNLTGSNSGNQLKAMDDVSGNSRQVDVRNNLDYGAIQVGIYKDDRMLALKSNISPGEKAVFQFLPTIWVGVVSDVEEGDVMDSAVMSQNNTELSLLGIASADIVLSGGGNRPFRFSLENVKRG
jgi:hypothetical protein